MTSGLQRPLGRIIQNRYALLGGGKSGGMGEVYAARDLMTDTKVAVKLFRAGHLDLGILQESFEREIRSLSQLRHLSIVNLLDHGEDSETRAPFIVLDWVDSDLSTLLRSSAIESWDHFYFSVFRPLLDGLSEAHSRGISHRDVKPSNILVDSAGFPLLTDFGISKLKTYLLPALTLNQFMTPPYAPPEIDDGSYTHTRDVFGLTAVAIECLTGATPADHKELLSALDRAPIPILIHSILRRALSSDPTTRQLNAAVLLAELDAAQEQRSVTQTARIDIYLDLSPPVITQLIDIFPDKSRDEVNAILLTDLNLVCGIGIPARLSASLETVVLYGASFICKTLVALPSRDYLVVRTASKVSPSITEKHRERSLQLNIRFRPGRAPKDQLAMDGMLFLQEQLESFRFQLAAQDAKAKENQLFQTWASILRAKTALEKAKENPIRYRGFHIQGNRLTFEVDGKVPGELLEQPRLVKDDGLVIVTGQVESTSESQLVMQISKFYGRELPRSGIVSIDIEAARLAIERQRAALDAVRYGRSVRSDLGSLLVSPQNSAVPSYTTPIQAIQPLLDASKVDAVSTGLAAKDFLVVEGPPGTGKTTFITELILQLLREQPSRRVLLTSQTHVALDNALEQLLTTNAAYRIVRLGRSGNPKISKGVDELLLENQMSEWRDEVLAKGKAFLRELAEQNGISHERVQIGMAFEKLAQIQKELSDLDVRKSSAEQQLRLIQKEARGREHKVPYSAEDVSLPSLNKYGETEDELTKLRTELRLKSVEKDDVRTQIKQLEPDAASLLDLPTDELKVWSELYLPRTPEHARVKSVFATHAEWQARFGRTGDFAPALLRSAQVVAGTCVGIAGVKGLQDLDFDVCIVDEASKATPTEMLVPLSRSRKWIVVGDQKQLPPFLDEGFRDPSVLREFNLNEASVRRTIFDRLHDELPDACKKMLSIQYRMVPAIGELISHCFYDDLLKSADKEWDRTLASILPTPVVWCSTSAMPDRFEIAAGDSYRNERELELVHDILRKISTQAALAGKTFSVAVLTGYGPQRTTMERRFAGSLKACKNLDIEWNTVDSVQGREADIAIYSVTRSNRSGKLGFLKETSRLNVALSRAKQYLVLIGDQAFLRSTPGENPFKRVLRFIDEHPQGCTIAESNL